MPVLAQAPPRAEDHLEPDASSLGANPSSDYDALVRNKMKDVYGRDVALYMIALPSFIPEYAVGLRGSDSYGPRAPYRIFVLAPAASIWTYPTIDALKRGLASMLVRDKTRKLQEQEIARAQASVPASIRDLAVRRCEIGISDALSDRIIKVWNKMLMRTRYSANGAVGLDGATYHFGMFVYGVGDLNGHVWSPERNSTTGNLVALANAMRGVCEKGEGEAQLEKLTTEIEHRLK